MSKKLSVIIHTYNEENNIEECLKSIAWADEIVVIDMHSQDKTAELSRKFTDKIFLVEHTGMADYARNFGLSKATGDWIFVLDADERVKPALRTRIETLIAQNQYDYVNLPFMTIMFGKWIRYSGWNFEKEYHVRLFQKGHVTWPGDVHQSPQGQGRGHNLVPLNDDEYVHHYNYKNISHFIEKLNRYTDHEVIKATKKNEKFSLEKLINESNDEFLDRFLKLQGTKDGLYGLSVCELMRFYRFSSYLKLWEKEGYPVGNLDEKTFTNQVGALYTNNYFKFLYQWHAAKSANNKFKGLILAALRKLIKFLTELSGRI